MGALLRAFAMLVSFAASILRMRLSLLSGECHTDAEPETLPEQESANLMEIKEAAASSQTTAQSQPTCTFIAAIGCGGGSGDGGGDDFTFPPVGRPTGIPTGARTGRPTKADAARA
jgi:hypothetical protein